jgi:hypothetical protein
VVGKESCVSEALSEPDEVRLSNQDEHVRLYYRWYNTSDIDSKFICIVVKMLENDAFVITAYPADRIKQGDLVWRKS